MKIIALLLKLLKINLSETNFVQGGGGWVQCNELNASNMHINQLISFSILEKMVV